MSRSSLPGFQSPAAGFDQPFEMLDACHDRVRRSLALLQRLVAHAAQHGADAKAQQAAADVLRYFDVAAPAHHLDEERHVVPALQASGDPALEAVAERLLADHRRITALWAALAPALRALGAGRAPDPAALGELTAAFVQVHDGHLPLEDEQAFPAARAHHAAGGPAALAAIGAEMAQRRGVG